MLFGSVVIASSGCGDFSDIEPREIAATGQAIKNGYDVPASSILAWSTVAFGNRCTGVIVGQRDVVTAAHCRPRAGDQVRFFSGADTPYASRTVAWVALPPGVDPYGDTMDVWEGAGNLDLADIAYLRLTSDIPSQAKIASLPSTYAADVWLIRVGVGTHDNVEPYGVLKYNFTQTYSPNVDDGRIFTSEDGVNPGDSGGPIYALRRAADRSSFLELWGVLWGSPWHEGAARSLYTSTVKKRSFLINLLSKGSKLGCYADSSSRALPYAHPSRLSPDACVEECSSRSYKFAGVQAGGQCYCGDTLGYDRLDASACNWTCDGGGYGCGGSWRNDIYVAGNHVGCFQDDPERALPYVHPTRLSPAACIAQCESRGETFAGVQAGGQCYCGDTLNYERVDAGECSWTCDGGGDGCGGSWRNDVYVANP